MRVEGSDRRSFNRLEHLWMTLSAVAFLSACVTPLGRIPPVNDHVAARLVVIRTADDTRRTPKLTLDGQVVSALRAGTYTEFPLQPGPHRLGVGCSTAAGLDWTERHRILLADPRTTYYFLIKTAAHCASIELLTHEQAETALVGSTHQRTTSVGE
jgi:hypothetical protein